MPTRHLAALPVALAATLLSGCLEMDAHLTLRDDGAATAVLDVRVTPMSDDLLALALAQEGGQDVLSLPDPACALLRQDEALTTLRDPRSRVDFHVPAGEDPRLFCRVVRTIADFRAAPDDLIGTGDGVTLTRIDDGAVHIAYDGAVHLAATMEKEHTPEKLCQGQTDEGRALCLDMLNDPERRRAVLEQMWPVTVALFAMDRHPVRYSLRIEGAGVTALGGLRTDPDGALALETECDAAADVGCEAFSASIAWEIAVPPAIR